jgi:hypothetical protein
MSMITIWRTFSSFDDARFTTLQLALIYSLILVNTPIFIFHGMDRALTKVIL